jgi:hypothetical protein
LSRAHENTLTLEATADDADEQSLRAHADEVAHNLARSLSFERGERFEVAFGGYHALRPAGQQGVIGYVHATLKPGAISASGTAEWEARDAAGNVIDSSADVGYIDRRIVAAAIGANASASLRKTGCQGILLRGEVLFIEVDAKALNPLKTTSIHNAARMVESCATNPIRGGPARKPT